MGQTNRSQNTKHSPSGRWLLGFGLASVSVMLWGTIPIALSLLLDRMDAITITWYRFLVGTFVLAVILRARGSLPSVAVLCSGRTFSLLVAAGVGLTGTFVVHLHALHFIPPGSSQVVMNLAPMFVLAGGVIVFRESFYRIQAAGLGLLITGYVLFFNQRLPEFLGDLSDYTFGALLVLSAAVIWSVYALAQKQLLKTCSSMGLMMIFFGFGVVIMFPFCSLSQVTQLSTEQYVVLAYASANTLIAYGCFAEALQHWEASRISMVVSVTPLLTLALSHPAHALWPDRIMPDELNAVGMFGAALAVMGSMLASLGGRTSGRSSTTSPDQDSRAPQSRVGGEP